MSRANGKRDQRHWKLQESAAQCGQMAPGRTALPSAETLRHRDLRAQHSGRGGIRLQRASAARTTGSLPQIPSPTPPQRGERARPAQGSEELHLPAPSPLRPTAIRTDTGRIRDGKEATKMQASTPLRGGRVSERLRAKLDARFGPRAHSNNGRQRTPPGSKPSRNGKGFAFPLGHRQSLRPPSSAQSNDDKDGQAKERRKSVVQMAAALLNSLSGPGDEDGSSADGPPQSVQASRRRQRDRTPSRWFHSTEEVTTVHGRLLSGSEDRLDPAPLRKLIDATGFTRRELYAMFMQFKALVAMSPNVDGIDRETFRRGIPMLAMEDDIFVNRVFELLDQDGSGTIEWVEFIEAIAKLDKGSRTTRATFLFDVYDEDSGGTVDEDEMYQYLVASLWLREESMTPFFREACRYFTRRVLSDVDAEHDGYLTRAKVLEYLHRHPEEKDVGAVFGRAIIPAAATFRVLEQIGYPSQGDCAASNPAISEVTHQPIQVGHIPRSKQNRARSADRDSDSRSSPLDDDSDRDTEYWKNWKYDIPSHLRVKQSARGSRRASQSAAVAPLSMPARSGRRPSILADDYQDPLWHDSYYASHSSSESPTPRQPPPPPPRRMPWRVPTRPSLPSDAASLATSVNSTTRTPQTYGELPSQMTAFSGPSVSSGVSSLALEAVTGTQDEGLLDDRVHDDGDASESSGSSFSSDVVSVEATTVWRSDNMLDIPSPVNV